MKQDRRDLKEIQETLVRRDHREYKGKKVIKVTREM